MRKNESEQVVATFRDHFHMPLTYVDATEAFLTELAGVSDPEKKRKIIGRVFIEVFEKKLQQVSGNMEFLAQGRCIRM